MGPCLEESGDGGREEGVCLFMRTVGASDLFVVLSVCWLGAGRQGCGHNLKITSTIPLGVPGTGCLGLAWDSLAGVVVEGVDLWAILVCVCLSVCPHSLSSCPVPSPLLIPLCALGELELSSALSADASRINNPMTCVRRQGPKKAWQLHKS